jgi:hypothetical protein
LSAIVPTCNAVILAFVRFIIGSSAGGNSRLVSALAEDVPILYNTPAKEVLYGGSGVTVVTADHRAVVADVCLVTVPLGVLKAGAIQFNPALPQRKQAAIDRLGCVHISAAPSPFSSPALLTMSTRFCSAWHLWIRVHFLSNNCI